MKKVLVLGATGSIGASTLRVISEKKDLYTPVGFSANKDYKKLLELLWNSKELKLLKFPQNCSAIKK